MTARAYSLFGSGLLSLAGAATIALASCGRVEDEASDAADAPPGVAAEELQQPHCWRYRNVTAAIGAAVIDCQGTIGPSSFEIKDGLLVPKFDSCRAPVEGAPAEPSRAFQALKTLLTVQQTEGEDPRVKECFAGQWNRWHELFQRTGITQCPSWKKTEIIGQPTSGTLRQLSKMYPRAPKVSSECNELASRAERDACIAHRVEEQFEKDPTLRHEQTLVDIVPPPKTSQTYTVSSSDAACDDPGACAAQCAAAFPGFVRAASGTRVDGDATYWLSDEDYGTYMGYQHQMAQYQGPPGDTYGHINRIDEECWRWSPLPKPNGSYFVMRLVDSGLPGLSHCGPL